LAEKEMTATHGVIVNAGRQREGPVAHEGPGGQSPAIEIQHHSVSPSARAVKGDPLGLLGRANQHGSVTGQSLGDFIALVNQQDQSPFSARETLPPPQTSV
jgi:hypothetical protein